MKKNLKSCIEQVHFEEPKCILNMNDYEMIRDCGLEPDLGHKKSAHITARWDLDRLSRVRISLGDPDLSAYRYLTFSVFAVGGEGGSFRLRFESDEKTGGESGYFCTLPVTRNGWNDYRLELPFLQSRGTVQGWDHIRAIELDAVAGGQANPHGACLSLDNFFGWETLAPQIYVKMPELKGSAMFSKTASYAVVDRRRLPIALDADPDARPFEESGILWLPMAPVAAVIGHRAVADNKANTLSFTYRRRQYVFEGNTEIYTVDGERATLPFRPVVRGGALFFPSGYLAEFFHWRQIFTDPTGLVILSNRKHIFDNRRDADTLRALNAEITFLHPTGEKILDDLRRRIPNPDKGRLLLLPEEWMALRKSAKTDAALGQLLDLLKESFGAKSDAYADAPVFADGVPSDTDLDGAITVACDRLQGFSVLYRLTGEKHYAERSAQECESLAGLDGWGAQTAILRTAAIGFSVSLAYDWCHSVWSEARKALIERALLRYLMRPGVDAYNGRANMWRSGSPAAAEINCALTAAALALAYVYPETSLKILQSSLRNALSCLDAYAPDGGHAEGLVAWERTTRSLALLIAMLESATGSDYGLASAPGFSATARFAIFAETSNGSWNYNNCPAKAIDTSVFGWFSRKYQNPAYAWIRQRDVLAGRKKIDVTDLIWYTPVSEESAPTLPLDAVYRRAGLAMLRSGWRDEDVFLGLHGGRNNVFGGELDAGSFLLEMGGERFFSETGGCEELPLMLRARAEGQNTVVIDPQDAPAPDQNPDAEAILCEAKSTAARAYAIMDMASTSDLILRGKRGILLTDDRRVAIVQDEMSLSESASVVWSAYTTAKIRSASARTLILEQNGKRLLCKLMGGSGRFAVTPMEGTAFSRITVKTEVKDKLRMAVAFRLMEDGVEKSDKLYELRPMSTWMQ